MTDFLVGVTVDRVQSFIYSYFDKSIQQRQTDADTLKLIRNSSRRISFGLQEEINEKFGAIKQWLPSCSGGYYFVIEADVADGLRNRLQELFETYYRESQGLIRLRYHVLEYPQASPGTEDETSLSKLKEMKAHLKSKQCLVSVIQENRGLLFSFQEPTSLQAKASTDFVPSDSAKQPCFVKSINELLPHSTAESVDVAGVQHDNKTKQKDSKSASPFRVAIIKADIDGAGDFFSQVDDMTSLKKASDILNQIICEEKLHKEARQMQLRLYPVYVTGDDIFFITALSDLPAGVRLCSNLLKRINQAFASNNVMCNKKSAKMTISIGIDVAFNDHPIRYYYGRVEEQLKIAKTRAQTKPLDLLLTKYLTQRVCINDCVYYEFETPSTNEKDKFNATKEGIPIWSHLMRDVRVLKYVRNQHKDETESTRSFVFNLLNALLESGVTDTTITEKERRVKRRRLVNVLLHFLFPDSLKPLMSTRKDVNSIGAEHKQLVKHEILINGKILSKFLQMGYGEEGGTGKLGFTEVYEQALNYLRILLLFTDTRFDINIESLNSEDELERDYKRAKRALLVESQNFLLSGLRENGLWGCFVEHKENIQGSNGSYELFIPGLPLKTAAFYKLKRLKDTNGSLSAERAATLIEQIVNSPSGQRPDSSEEEDGQSQETERFEFSRELFIESMRENGGWNGDYVDSLMLFYQYYEAKAKVKKLEIF
jgi:hypothetical protein